MLSKKNIAKIVFVLSLYNKIALAAPIGMDYTHSVSPSWGNAASAPAPGTWVKVADIDIPTYDSVGLELSGGCYWSYLCTSAHTPLLWNSKPSYIITLSRHYQTITDAEGRKYEFSIAFPGGDPTIGITELNQTSDYYYHVISSSLNSEDWSIPSDISSSRATPRTNGSGYCGNVGGCNYIIASYFKTGSKKPALYIRFPYNLNQKKFYFDEFKILSIKTTIYGRQIETSAEKTLYIKGSINIPQRCYTSIEDGATIDFGNIYANAQNGAISKSQKNIKTTCHYAPSGTKQYIKVEPVSGGELSNNNYSYSMDKDKNGSMALGITFGINKDPDCNPSTDDKNKFGTEYLIRNIAAATSQIYTDNINFGLCKYGVPFSSGQKSVSVRVISRWVS
ncbi:hypothetical protein [Escherichia albertii]|uniref:hypothetical protein n=1 Tax=Escherichia albertii TaxID=208962 RepID=UPI0032B7C5F2